jgi:protein TonB
VALPAAPVPLPPPPAARATALAADVRPDAALPAPPVNPVVAEPPPGAFGSTAGVPGAIVGPGTPRSAGAWSLPGAGDGITLAPPPTPAAPVRPGGDIRPPARTYYVPPAYPALARAAKVEGLVILECTIDESGVVRDVRVLRSVPPLDGAAIDAVTQWRYTPTRLNGRAVPVLLTVTVTFTLK